MGVVTAIERFELELPDSQPWFARTFSRWPAQLLVCLAFGLLLRCAVFGDPAVHIDEAWYFLVGQWMHEGALPYVDLWDRKPFLLFALYYLFAAVSHSVLAYQIPAWIAASVTAFVIARIALRWSGVQGAVLAGVSYLALLDLFEGIGGQAPVFYNLIIATAAWLLVRSFHRLREGSVPPAVFGAMLLCGLAIMVKQTTLFESVFFGAWAVALLWRSGRPVPWAKVMAMAAIGAAPTLVIAAYYYLIGHWYEFWQAMVVSNVSKQSATALQYATRAIVLILRLWLIVGVVVFALASTLRGNPWRPFLIAWTLAALIGFMAVPNLYYHYCLPLMVPFSVVAAVEFNRRTLGVIIAGFLILSGVLTSAAYDFPRHWRNQRDMRALASLIAGHSPRGTLLAFDAPPLLYSMSGTRSLTPLTFPNHLNHEIERNVSHLDTRAEMLRVLAARPGAVAISQRPRVKLFNRENWSLVARYTRDRCRFIGHSRVFELGRNDDILIYGDCA